MSEAKLISADQIKKHQAHGDLWLVIHGSVYDVSEFMEDHPGGAHALLDQAGIDATSAFENVGHSNDARALMERFQIGKAADMGSDVRKSSADFMKLQTPTHNFLSKIGAVAVAVTLTVWLLGGLKL